MTESEWLACGDSRPMLASIVTRASPRKLRLFAVACGRATPAPRTRYSLAALEAAERFADDPTRIGDLREMRHAVRDDLYLEAGEPPYDAAFWACSVDIASEVGRCCFYAATAWASASIGRHSDEGFADSMAKTFARQAAILREVFGNPFHPDSISPAWRTANVVALARTAYDDHSWETLPILADALEDAGCDHPDILAHLRGEGPHVRGCWAIDAVLGLA